MVTLTYSGVELTNICKYGHQESGVDFSTLGTLDWASFTRGMTDLILKLISIDIDVRVFSSILLTLYLYG